MMNQRPMVLIVDDDGMIRTLLQHLLEREGVETRMARDGHEALQLISERKPDLVLTDLVMPGMDGFCLIGTLRRQDHFKKMPILAISSMDGPDHADRALSLGANGFVLKTELKKNMPGQVRRLLTGRASHGNEQPQTFASDGRAESKSAQ
ncbi:MAG: response regulator [Nitrospinae bacterium]|nr:response regulator [Nitrospinota bacterium]